MRSTQGHKDRRRNYGGPRRGVNYVPKHYKPYESLSSPPAFNPPTEAKTSVKASEPQAATSTKSYGKLTRAVLITLYAKSPAPPCLQNVKNLKDVYSEESIMPQTMAEFTLPMTKAIMPPRRVSVHEHRESHSRYHEGYNREEDEDQGIAKAAEISHPSLNNAPLWFDSQVSQAKEGEAVKSEDLFSIESLASRQLSLEEEKAKFNKKSASGNSENMGIKVSADSLFANNEEEGEYSSVDVKYENALKSKHKVAQELFANSHTDSSEHSTAIDINNLEAQMMKEVKQEVKEDGEEMPVWDAYSAEEIKQEAHHDFSSWRFNLNPLNDIPENSIANAKELGEKKAVREGMNPFCHSSLNITETDKVWYYCDIQKTIQGPFNSIEMNGWNKAGYFPPTLPIRCGKYSPFLPLQDLLSSIKLRQQQELENEYAQHFNASNLGTFFDPAINSVDSKPSTAVLSVEELEASFKSMAVRDHKTQPDNPPIDPHATGCYTKDEAHDLKALLGFQSNAKG